MIYDFKEGEVLYFNKPLYWTSFDLVNKIRYRISRALDVKKIKVGHAGTLDPLATGVLIICTGKATKRMDEFQYQTKEYVATLALGSTTPSFDLETEIDQRYETAHITQELVEQTLPQFLGSIDQIPPAYSAVKVNGDRAYALARKGEEVVLKAKTLVIDEIELLDFQEMDSVDSSQDSKSGQARNDKSSDEGIMTMKIRVVCSKGTYIRALARDIGVALHSGAHLIGLERTRIGDVTLAQCIEINEFTI